MNRLVLNASDYVRPLYVGNFIRNNEHKQFLWILPDHANLSEVSSFVRCFVPHLKIIAIPELDTSYDDIIKPDKSICYKRIQAANAIIKDTLPKLVLASEPVISGETIAPKTLEESTLQITENSKIDDIANILTELGYERLNEVNSRGEFAIRGDIIDVFCDKPYRISLFGTTVERIREFTTSSQLSSGSDIKQITIIPMRENVGELDSVLSLFNNGYVVFKDVTFDLKLTQDETLNFSELSDIASEDKKIVLKHKEIYISSSKNPIETVKELADTDTKKVLITAQSETLAKRLSYILNIPVCGSFNHVHKKGICLLSCKQSFETETFRVISGSQIFHEEHKRRNVRVNKENLLKNVSSLLEGDYVVHIHHGIGQFKKLSPLRISGKLHDFIEIIYAEGEKLFVPVENINLLSRYSAETSPARLDKLGSSAWQRRKNSIKSKITELAGELIRTAALRKNTTVAPPEFDQDEFDAFCNNFPYVETRDQERAVREILDDFTSGNLMDRLICGDVGFGKTEIAMRAAFIVSRTKQVCIISPTTILCRQHYESFVTRFSGFNTRIVELSRNTSGKAIKDEIENGTAQIIVATHAAFKQNFHNLGLLIIDEEQHFGVKQKESIKSEKKDVHILTLSATPIPRTLQLAVSGIREISIISTPPVERMPSRVLVTEADGKIIREAILREIQRGGQVFYTCPHIADIRSVESILLEHVPEIRYRTLHGQMLPREIERTMLEFKENKFQLLVSTNIIESGIDIRNTNTLIVHNAHMLGLATLYQLKGRIGRSNLQAFAYFTLPVKHKISKNAERRLRVIQNLEKLGAGFSLASYDMDIRGAGNILGEEQSGHIKEIGIELYQKMLKNALEQTSEEEDIRINLNLPVLIPDTYITDSEERISYYQRISSSKTKEELFEVKRELEDRFGIVPKETLNLLYVVDMKNRCRSLGVTGIDMGPSGSIITFSNPTSIDRILEICRESKGLARIKQNNKVLLKNQFGIKEFLSMLAIDK